MVVQKQYQIVLLLLIIIICECKLPIPLHQDGYVLGNHGSGFQIEVFYDLACPDSKRSHIRLLKAYKGLVQEDQEKMKIIFHMFPLPYHRSSYILSQGIRPITKLLGQSDSALKYIETIFKRQNEFSNTKTHKFNHQMLVEYLVNILQSENVLPKSDLFNVDIFKQQFNVNSIADLETQFAFKYGCQRGVIETPYFLINGMPYEQGIKNTFEDWNQLLTNFGIKTK